MPDEDKPIAKGSVFEWRVPLQRAVRCTVNRVAEDGSWADFTMTGGGSSWGKRMALPLDSAFKRVK